MRYETKIAVVVRDDLPVWQKLNVTCFLSGGLVGAYPELAGERYTDASGRGYGPLIRQPIMVYAGSGDDLRKVLEKAHGRHLDPSIYTSSLFSTMNDADNRAAITAVPTESLDLVGIGLHADRRAVDKVVKGLKLHA